MKQCIMWSTKYRHGTPRERNNRYSPGFKQIEKINATAIRVGQCFHVVCQENMNYAKITV